MEEILGRISSVESMGLVDGPGIRYVVFLQGCQLRCKYCHNPETWSKKGGKLISPKELVDNILRYKSYFGSEGGVTFSGGEPLLQPSFLKECLKLCRKNNISSVIDTSGAIIVPENELKEILSLCDLVILDIKAPSEEEYQKLTGRAMAMFNKFLSVVQELGCKLWLRTVIVPSLNDNKEYIARLANFIKPIKNVEKIELLPYKSLGEVKYKKFGMRYPLAGLKDMDELACKELEKLLNNLVKQ